MKFFVSILCSPCLSLFFLNINGLRPVAVFGNKLFMHMYVGSVLIR